MDNNAITLDLPVNFFLYPYLSIIDDLRTPVSEEQARAGRRGSADLHHIYVA